MCDRPPSRCLSISRNESNELTVGVDEDTTAVASVDGGAAEEHHGFVGMGDYFAADP